MTDKTFLRDLIVKRLFDKKVFVYETESIKTYGYDIVNHIKDFVLEYDNMLREDSAIFKKEEITRIASHMMCSKYLEGSLSHKISADGFVEGYEYAAQQLLPIINMLKTENDNLKSVDK